MVTSQSSNKSIGCISASVGKHTPIKFTMFKCLKVWITSTIFLSTCLVGSFMKTRASLSRSSVPVLRVLVFTATCPQAFHLESFQKINWQSHSEAKLKLKTLYVPQFSNQDSTWVCPCRPCHRLPCLGFGPCQASPRGRCSCGGTWTICSCVFVVLMELVLERNVKGMMHS